LYAYYSGVQVAIDSGNRRVYSFKSVGESVQDYDKRQKLRKVVQPLGLKTPLVLSNNSSGLFDMHYDVGNQVNDNLRNLILTNKGERLGFPDFGANLIEILFELGADNIDAEAIRRISNTVSKYMPYVILETFEPVIIKNEMQAIATIGIRVYYSIPTLGVTNRGLEIILYVAG